MIKYLFLLFILVPMLEIYLLIKVGSVIGALSTVLLVVLTAVIGAYLLRQQGFATLQRVRGSLEQGELPATSLLEGAILLVSGALLLTPGFFTDVIGFICMVPKARQVMATWLLTQFSAVAIGGVSQHDNQQSAEKGHASPRVFEGEFKRDDDNSSGR